MGDLSNGEKVDAELETKSLVDMEAQADEIMALESIFGTENVVLHDSTLKSGQIKVFMDLPDNFHLVNDALSTNDNNALNSSTENLESEKKKVETDHAETASNLETSVKHLPPLVLHFTLPNLYPSKEKPIFTLFSTWLDRKSLSILCRELDNIWKKDEGTEVLFSWVSFLKEESMTFLGFKEKYDISSHRKIAAKCKCNSGMLTRSGSGDQEKKRKSISNISQTTLETDHQQQNLEDPELAGPSNSSSSINGLTQDVSKPSEPVAGSSSVRAKTRLKAPHTKRANARMSCKHNTCAPLDHRAVCEYNAGATTPEESLMQYLIDYNEEKEETEFNDGVHTCLVCFCDKMGSDFIRLKCRHAFCKACMKACYVTHIQEGNVRAVKCMAHQCPEVPTFTKIKTVVGEDLFNRYDSILLQQALESMDDLIYCPRIQCAKPVICDPNDKLAECSSCGYKFCSACKMVYHGVDPCRFKSEEHKRLFEEYTKGTAEQKSILEKNYGKKQLKILVETTLSENWLEKQSKPCPHCKAPIDKFEGCNKVTCCKCGSYFCWVCLHQLDRANPYFHFNNPGSLCYNNLFAGVNPDGNNDDDDDDDDDDIDIDDWLEEETHWLDNENETNRFVIEMFAKFRQKDSEIPQVVCDRLFQMCLSDDTNSQQERLKKLGEIVKSDEPVAKLLEWMDEEDWDNDSDDE